MALPLAQEFLVLAESPDPQNVYAGSPSLARLPSGRLIASYEWFRPSPLKEKVPDQMDVLVSDDGGDTWRKSAALDFIWPSLFAHGDDLYVIDARGELRVVLRTIIDGHSPQDHCRRRSARIPLAVPPAVK